MLIAFPREERSGLGINYLIYRCGGSDGIADCDYGAPSSRLNARRDIALRHP